MNDAGHAQGRPLRPYERIRLIVALVVLGALAGMCAIGIGVELHGYSETQDSLAHWQARLREEESTSVALPRRGFDAPAARIRRLEAELDAVPGRLLPMGLVLVLSSVLVVLGWRALRRDRRTA